MLKNDSIRLCIVNLTVCWLVGLFRTVDTERYVWFKKKVLDSTIYISLQKQIVILVKYLLWLIV